MDDNAILKLFEQFLKISDKLNELVEKYNASKDVKAEIEDLSKELRIYQDLLDNYKTIIDSIVTKHKEGCPQCPNSKKLEQLGPWDEFLKTIKRISTHDVYFLFLGAISSASLIALVALFWKFILKIN